MVRTLLGAAVALILFTATTWADELKGKIKNIDTTKNVLTLTVDDTDLALNVAKDAKIFQMVGKNPKKAKPQDITGGLSGLTVGSEVTVIKEKTDGKDVVTQVKLAPPAKKKKKKNK
jgi:hypothetical protein